MVCEMMCFALVMIRMLWMLFVVNVVGYLVEMD